MNRQSGLRGVLSIFAATMVFIGSPKSHYDGTMNPKTILNKCRRRAMGKGPGHNQRKRRKLIRQNPHLLRAKKYR